MALPDDGQRPESNVSADDILARIFGEASPVQPRSSGITTEDEWLTSTNLDEMHFFLQPRVSWRKPLLFALAGCNRIRDRIRDSKLRQFLDIVERFAEGKTTRHEIDANAKELTDDSDPTFAAITGLAELDAHPMAPANYVTKYVPLAMCKQDISVRSTESRETIDREKSALLLIARDIFGNPFRPLRVDPKWLTWNDDTVARLARGIYEEQEFDRLPLLANALEDAGCQDAEILDHCRRPGNHVRGCWVLDLLLDKE